jgi:hypothetical protein
LIRTPREEEDVHVPLELVPQGLGKLDPAIDDFGLKFCGNHDLLPRTPWWLFPKQEKSAA